MVSVLHKIGWALTITFYLEYCWGLIEKASLIPIPVIAAYLLAEGIKKRRSKEKIKEWRKIYKP